MFPLGALFSAARAIGETYQALFEAKTTASRIEAMVGFHEFEEIVGVPDWRELESLYGLGEDAA